MAVNVSQPPRPAIACNGTPEANIDCPADPAKPACANAKIAPKVTVAQSEASPTSTKRAGPCGRSHAVNPRSTTTRPKPATSRTAPTGSSQSQVGSRPPNPRKPASSAASPAVKRPSAGSAHFSENSGFATSTGTNWNSAPHIARLSQPIQTTWTKTSVSGDARCAAG